MLQNNVVGKVKKSKDKNSQQTVFRNITSFHQMKI